MICGVSQFCCYFASVARGNMNAEVGDVFVVYSILWRIWAYHKETTRGLRIMTWTEFENAFNPDIILPVRWCRATVSVVYEVVFKSVIQQSCYVVSKAISSIERRLICSDSSVYKNKYVKWWDGSTPCSQSRCAGKQVVHGAREFQVWVVSAHVQ
jgi:hypothetical protein